MKRHRPFLVTAKRATDARPAATRAAANRVHGPIGPGDIVIVNSDNVRVCRVETANGPLFDGPLPLLLCRNNAGDQAAGLVDGLRVTEVGGVLMLRVE